MNWFLLLLVLFNLPAFASGLRIDDNFIKSVVNKSVAFKPKSSGATVLPNCVATTLRAGGFLPVFSGSDTEYFYNTIAPQCFEHIKSPQRGDVGVLFYLHNGIKKFAHIVLFLDSDMIFEKPSPNLEDKFRYNSWLKIKSTHLDPHLRFEVLRFKNSRNCPLKTFSEYYDSLDKDDPVKRLNSVNEKRIQNQNWRKPTSKEQLLVNLVSSRLAGLQDAVSIKIVQDILFLFDGLATEKKTRELSGKHEDFAK